MPGRTDGFPSSSAIKHGYLSSNNLCNQGRRSSTVFGSQYSRAVELRIDSLYKSTRNGRSSIVASRILNAGESKCTSRLSGVGASVKRSAGGQLDYRKRSD